MLCYGMLYYVMYVCLFVCMYISQIIGFPICNGWPWTMYHVLIIQNMAKCGSLRCLAWSFRWDHALCGSRFRCQWLESQDFHIHGGRLQMSQFPRLDWLRAGGLGGIQALLWAVAREPPRRMSLDRGGGGGLGKTRINTHITYISWNLTTDWSQKNQKMMQIQDPSDPGSGHLV